MQKRSVKIGDYITADHGWTLTGLSLSAPEQKTNYVEKSGGDGSWDLSTVLTGGLPRYKDRTLTITLECSEGTRADREALLNDLVNTVDGLEWKVVLPDRPEHYLAGRLHVAVNQNSLAYAAVTITGTVAPWLYSARETIIDLGSTGGVWETATLYNKGRLAVVPVITAGTGANMQLRFGAISSNVTPGTYEWAGLLLTPGRHKLEYSGTGPVRITYREAVLR